MWIPFCWVFFFSLSNSLCDISTNMLYEWNITVLKTYFSDYINIIFECTWGQQYAYSRWSRWGNVTELGCKIKQGYSSVGGRQLGRRHEYGGIWAEIPSTYCTFKSIALCEAYCLINGKSILDLNLNFWHNDYLKFTPVPGIKPSHLCNRSAC